MSYISQSLTFEVDKIHYTEYEDTHEVMMDWEDPLMSASAAYICEGGGDILEIGFGMGISAGYIQQHTINSHTIIENHPDIIPKAQAWAADKSNVNIVEGSWYDVKDTLSTYDGLFMDTWEDQHMNYFSSSLSSLIKVGGRATWWNGMLGSKNISQSINEEGKRFIFVGEGEELQTNYYCIPDVTYDVYDVTPPTNNYFNYSQYYLPKKQF
jgi:protein arginine N-methyltransferase 2